MMRSIFSLILFLTYFLTIISGNLYPCNSRKTSYGSVCVCNSTYCDKIPKLENLEKAQQYQLYTTSKENLGFTSLIGNFSNNSSSIILISSVTISSISNSHQFQTIYGFGGAFTDATGINILSLKNSTQNELLNAYFGKEGIEYSFGRVPIAGTDYSTHGYTYCDNGENGTLDSWSLQPEDFNYKIPIIQKALNLRGKENLKLFASAWSAPIWMKNTDKYNGFGKIQSKYYALWAEYYLKFFEAYEKNNITFWGVTTQNEPEDGLIGVSIPNNGFTSSEMNNWIKTALGPTIRNSSFKDLKIILHDDNRYLLPALAASVLTDEEVLNYADGIGLHWYTDFFTPKIFLDLAKSSKKPLFVLATEACSGYLAQFGLEKSVQLGDWNRAINYLNDIITDLSYNMVGWVDWNMVLNETGGPNYINNPVDSPIIVNTTSDEFYKQPMFYALGHFSKFVIKNSKRIQIDDDGVSLLEGVKSLAFLRPDNKIALILYNSLSISTKVKINILGSTEIINLEANSINTLLSSV